MTHLTFYEMLTNPDNQSVRVTFKVPDGSFVVVKFFDPDQTSVATFKWFLGSYEKTRAYWNTTEASTTGRSDLIAAARRVIALGVAALTQ